MLVHKGGQINNVQLITGVRIAEMSQLKNCSVMCTKDGSYCETKKREKKSGGRAVGLGVRVVRLGGQGGFERRTEVFVKNQIKFFVGRAGVSGRGGGSGWM